MTDINTMTALERAANDSYLTRELVEEAERLGYRFNQGWSWSRYFNRIGEQYVGFGDELVSMRSWDVGSTRRPPYAYRRGSQHHKAVLAALADVRHHAAARGVTFAA